MPLTPRVLLSTPFGNTNTCGYQINLCHHTYLWRRGGTTLDPYMGEADRKGGSCGFDLPCALWALVSGPARWEPVPVETAGCCCCCCSWLAERGGICRGPPEGWLWVWGEGEAVKWGVDCRGGRPICGHCRTRNR
eukprot:1160802-Pelagomonas_calceolata.AAC.4